MPQFGPGKQSAENGGNPQTARDLSTMQCEQREEDEQDHIKSGQPVGSSQFLKELEQHMGILIGNRVFPGTPRTPYGGLMPSSAQRTELLLIQKGELLWPTLVGFDVRDVRHPNDIRRFNFELSVQRIVSNDFGLAPVPKAPAQQHYDRAIRINYEGQPFLRCLILENSMATFGAAYYGMVWYGILGYH